jgi:hypothetical protein
MEVPLRTADDVTGRSSTWRAQVEMRAEPQHVLEALTEVEACQAWSPVPFELNEPDLRRLEAGTRVGVIGSAIGRPVWFCVEVLEASPRSLRLRAAGPVELRAEYKVQRAGGGSFVAATVSVRGGSGRMGGIVTRLTGALLGRGLLHTTLGRIEGEAARRQRRARTDRAAAA